MAVKTSYRKLEKSVKRVWLKALRSGKFKQADGQLCKEIETYDEYDNPTSQGFGHCCLGVLADLKGKLHSHENLGVEFGPEFDDEKQTFKETCRLTPTQKLNRSSGFIPASWVDPKAQKVLADLNDNGKSFKRIATWIEKNL